MNKYLLAAIKRDDTAENLSRYERQQELERKRKVEKIELRNRKMENMQDIKRGDKEIDDIKPIIKYCTMSQELKMDTISRIKEAMSKLIYLYNIKYRNNNRK